MGQASGGPWTGRVPFTAAGSAVRGARKMAVGNKGSLLDQTLAGLLGALSRLGRSLSL